MSVCVYVWACVFVIVHLYSYLCVSGFPVLCLTIEICNMKNKVFDDDLFADIKNFGFLRILNHNQDDVNM